MLIAKLLQNCDAAACELDVDVLGIRMLDAAAHHDLLRHGQGAEPQREAFGAAAGVHPERDERIASRHERHKPARAKEPRCDDGLERVGAAELCGLRGAHELEALHGGVRRRLYDRQPERAALDGEEQELLSLRAGRDARGLPAALEGIDVLRLGEVEPEPPFGLRARNAVNSPAPAREAARVEPFALVAYVEDEVHAPVRAEGTA